MNKKFICLTLAIVLVLALCMPVAARYIHCRFCEDGKITTRTQRTIIGTVPCEKDESMTDYVYLVVKEKFCDSCGYVEEVDRYEETYCRH